MSTGFTVLALSILAIARADIPSGYILQITPTCGADGVADGAVDIVTDLNAAAMAVCKDGTKVHFTTTDDVNFNLPFSYQGGSETQACIFSKRDNSKVFVAKIIVSYGDSDNQVHQYTEEYQVSCTFGGTGDDDTANSNIVDALIAPQEIQTNMGNDTVSTIQLLMVDVLHNDLSASQVDLGRIVRLMATFTGAEGGIRPVSCDAISSSAQRYAILRAGCGDGVVFEKNEGFVTTNKETLSPYFKAFSIENDRVLKFECNFTLCSSTCNGNSCTVASRRRRGLAQSPPSDKDLTMAATGVFTLTGVETGQSAVGSVEHVQH